MDSNTLLTVGFVALVAATLFVTAHAGAVAVGLLPPARGTDDAKREAREPGESKAVEAGESGPVEADGRVSADGDDTGRSRITAADHERIRSHLEKDRFHRRPDDLLPSDDDGS
ncbi:hypothetical protein DU500_15470 [Haloplanus rubicundus]|uniref:Uncharacterized protein n=1 Tax=Haloplanus rubicundus TaxID=1547898 RepID=A0A345E692_9EURY|nr:hypothetical protein [Haloplanus rubicundus]AXG07714.1 hypothetical protein DU500_15470 [Haloplanus rubicundus]AXG11133.1 hypothetical protein DU484_15450 [Haloplanus rubicundus]